MALKKTGRKPKGNLVQEIDAAIALLTRVRSLAIAGVAAKADESPAKKQQSKRTLSPEAREAIAAGQRRRWAKVKRQQRQTQRTARA